MDIDLSDYVAGGYFITRYADEGFWHSDLLPERIISLSSCIGKRLEIMWTWSKNVQAYQSEAIDLGVAVDKLTAFQDWGLQVDADPAYGIHNLGDALYAANEFFKPASNVIVIGAALHQELVDDFLIYRPYPDEHPNYIVFQPPDVELSQKSLLENHFVKDREPVNTGGNPLGYEILRDRYHLGHSWLCGGIERDMYELFNIHPNEYGLINSYEEAKKVYGWIAEDKLQGTRSEPEPYHPWLLVQYPLT